MRGKSVAYFDSKEKTYQTENNQEGVAPTQRAGSFHTLVTKTKNEIQADPMEFFFIQRKHEKNLHRQLYLQTFPRER